MQLKYITNILFILILLINACTQSENTKPFLLTNVDAVIIEKKGNEVSLYWEFENLDILWDSNLYDVNALGLYKDSIKFELGVEIFHSVVFRESIQDNTIELDTNEKNGDKLNAHYVHSGRLAKIRPINNLEAQILNYQINRFPLFSHPTEFQSFILMNDSLDLIRVYFVASDEPWPPKPHAIFDELVNELKKGWRLKYHLHNHYEPSSNNFVGIMAPSLADVQFFRMLASEFGLETALITNGFTTVEIMNHEF